MRHRMSMLLVCAVTALMLATGSAHAQTTAAGPYYATPAWDQTLPASTRFLVLSNMNGEAVLDRETGVVWERAPSSSGGPLGTGERNWRAALAYCVTLTKGSRRGWRLPTIQELASLIDPSAAAPGPALPAGNPFVRVRSNVYWSATVDIVSPDFPWAVNFFGGGMGASSRNDNLSFVWCVRGGSGIEAQ